MIVLIAGATGLGKSHLATRLGARLGASRLVGTSDLREVLRVISRSEAVPDLLCSTYSEAVDPQALLSRFERQCEFVHEAAEAIIAARPPTRAPSVIEGVHVTPRLAYRLAPSPLLNLVILRPSEVEHRDRLIARGASNDSKSWEKYQPNFSNIRLIGQHIEDAWNQFVGPVHFIPSSQLDEMSDEAAFVDSLISRGAIG